MKNSRLGAVLFVGLGMLLGYAAASGKTNPFQRAGAAPTAAAAIVGVSHDETKPHPAGEGCVRSGPDKANCCDDMNRGQLLAMADPKVKDAVEQGEAKDKPNILFIMGDDIGWMQPSCYHRGLMVGETPNIDRIAAEGGMFMHYYAESSCTAGRCAFITGMHPYRAGMVLPQLPGAISYLRPGTPCLAKFLLRPRLQHRRVRQEPPRRPSGLAADARTASRNSGATSITWTRCSR